MLHAEEKLPVQVAQVNGIQVDNVDFSKARHYEILQQLTSYPTSPNHQDSRLEKTCVSIPLLQSAEARQNSPTCFIR